MLNKIIIKGNNREVGRGGRTTLNKTRDYQFFMRILWVGLMSLRISLRIYSGFAPLFRENFIYLRIYLVILRPSTRLP